jgi:hypothetical protein
MRIPLVDVTQCSSVIAVADSSEDSGEWFQQRKHASTQDARANCRVLQWQVLRRYCNSSCQSRADRLLPAMLTQACNFAAQSAPSFASGVGAVTHTATLLRTAATSSTDVTHYSLIVSLLMIL